MPKNTAGGKKHKKALTTIIIHETKPIPKKGIAAKPNAIWLINFLREGISNVSLVTNLSYKPIAPLIISSPKRMGTITKFAPIVLGYAKTTGGEGVFNLLKKVMN